MDAKPRVLALHAHTLEGMFQDLREVGEALGRDAKPLERRLRSRLAAMERRLKGATRRKAFCLEWLDPPFASGHWVPEQLARAGGLDALAKPGKPSRRVTWNDIVKAAPEVMFILPCGFGLDRAAQELPKAASNPEWNRLPAVQSGEVYLVDGPSYFNGAGPRLVDGIEILAGLLHPDRFPKLHRKGWRRLSPAELNGGNQALHSSKRGS